MWFEPQYELCLPSLPFRESAGFGLLHPMWDEVVLSEKAKRYAKAVPKLRLSE